MRRRRRRRRLGKKMCDFVLSSQEFFDILKNSSILAVEHRCPPGRALFDYCSVIFRSLEFNRTWRKRSDDQSHA